MAIIPILLLQILIVPVVFVSRRLTVFETQYHFHRVVDRRRQMASVYNSSFQKVGEVNGSVLEAGAALLLLL